MSDSVLLQKVAWETRDRSISADFEAKTCSPTWKPCAAKTSGDVLKEIVPGSSQRVDTAVS